MLSSSLSPRSARSQKREALLKLCQLELPLSNTHRFLCHYQGVKVQFHCQSERFRNQIQNFLPLLWQSPPAEDFSSVLEIYWLGPQIFFTDSSWQDDPESNCEISSLESGETAVQRDFIGWLSPQSHSSGHSGSQSRNQARIVAHEKLDDGFFNALRWLLPRRMLASQSMLLHSSCVLGKNNLAYFFLGPSGAGKTTVTQLSEGRQVLGDDMNVLHFAGDKLFAEAGALGQRFSNPRFFSQKFPVGGMFWLKQSSRHSLNFPSNSSPTQGSLRLLSSCANLFWQDSSPEQARLVLAAVKKILEIQALYELEFKLDGGFWDEIEKQ